MRKTIKILLVLSAVSLLAVVGIVWAYGTSMDSNTNTFTVGNVNIELNEEHWDAESATDMKPGYIAEKDPVVTNSGGNNAFAFIEVSVPKKNIYTYDPVTKTRNEQAVTPLFTLKDISPEWVLINTDNSSEDIIKYVYAYGTSSECTALKSGESTPAVFLSTQYCYAVEGQDLDKDSLVVTVKAFAIQADNITDEDTKDPESVWSILYREIG